jgi:hypothetical protein
LWPQNLAEGQLSPRKLKPFASRRLLLLFYHGVTKTQRKGWESLKKMVDLGSPNSRQRLRATARAEWYASVKEEKQNEAPQRAYGGDCVGGTGNRPSHACEGTAD